MIHGFPELPIGGLLVAPFVPQAISAFVIFLLATPVRRRLLTGRVFANPALAEVCLFLAILAVVMILY